MLSDGHLVQLEHAVDLCRLRTVFDESTGKYGHDHDGLLLVRVAWDWVD